MTSLKMTSVVITSKAADVREYNVAMSSLNAAFEPIAAKHGGSCNIGSGAEKSKPSLMISFVSAASADKFEAEAKKAAAARTWYGARKLPAMNMVRG